MSKVVHPSWDDRLGGSAKCAGKVAHSTRAEAERAMLALDCRPGSARAYACPHCGQWHWGRNKKARLSGGHTSIRQTTAAS